MKFRYLSILSLIVCANSAVAQPISGTIIGNLSTDILNYECLPMDGNPNRLTCNFVQVLLSKKAKPEGLAALMAQLKAEFESDSDSDFQPTMCSYSVHLRSIIDGNAVAVTDITTEEDLRKAIEDYQNAPTQARADMERFAVDAETFCAEPTFSNLETIFTNTHEQDTRSCQAFVNKYSQTYVRVSEWLWAVESTPSGVCGVVNTSKFIGSEKYGSLWEHESSKIIMNKEGQDLISCSDLDESKTLYSWKNGTNFLGCDYLQ